MAFGLEKKLKACTLVTVLFTWYNLILITQATEVQWSHRRQISQDAFVPGLSLFRRKGVLGSRKILQEKNNNTLKADSQKDSGKNVETKITESKNSTQADNKEIEDLASLIVPELKLRCTQFLTWKAEQVKRCLAFAEDGIEYDPIIFDDDDMTTSGDFDVEVVQRQMMHVAGYSVSRSNLFLFLVVLAAAVLLLLKYPRVLGKSHLWYFTVLKAKLGRKKHIFWNTKKISVSDSAHEG